VEEVEALGGLLQQLEAHLDRDVVNALVVQQVVQRTHQHQLHH
jgi:hypothetical protein